MTAPMALSVRGLSKNFGAISVAKSIDVDLAAGARVGLIGPNGAGKTTFVNLLTGFIRPDAGEISLGGERIEGLKTEERVRRGLARTRSTRCSPRKTPATMSPSPSPSARGSRGE